MATVRGAERTGPDNSSGTNNTIRATRMIAPVSRSFTLTTHHGGETAHCKRAAGRARAVLATRRAAVCLVYPKPLQCRAHGVHRAAHDDTITGLRCGRCQLAPGLDGGSELGAVRGRAETCGELRGAAA